MKTKIKVRNEKESYQKSSLSNGVNVRYITKVGVRR